SEKRMNVASPAMPGTGEDGPRRAAPDERAGGGARGRAPAGGRTRLAAPELGVGLLRAVDGGCGFPWSAPAAAEATITSDPVRDGRSLVRPRARVEQTAVDRPGPGQGRGRNRPDLSVKTLSCRCRPRTHIPVRSVGSGIAVVAHR